MTEVRNIGDLYDRLSTDLKLRWLTDNVGTENPLRGEVPSTANQTLVGTLNCIHPNRIQIIGHAELVYLANLGATAYKETVEKLFVDQPAGIIFSDDIEPALEFYEWAERTGTALLGSALGDQELIGSLHYFLTNVLAERITLHGVFMEVLGMGVLLTGDAAVGKSELALELISRGHRLVADDAPEFARIAPDTVNGVCPPLLRDFLEVRGLGILNIRAMFGDSAVRPKKNLNLVIALKNMTDRELAEIDRLTGSLSTRDILGLSVPEITMPVAPGRNLAILVEAAVRNQTLRQRGYDASAEFDHRHTQLIGEQNET
jgi:HPr kinase/phosphorylase